MQRFCVSKSALKVTVSVYIIYMFPWTKSLLEKGAIVNVVHNNNNMSQKYYYWKSKT